MQAFIMFGKYSAEAASHISAERTVKVNDVVKKHGGEVRSLYALLGSPDLVLTLELPGVREAAAVSVALTKATGITFTTAPAVPADEFDKIIAKG